MIMLSLSLISLFVFAIGSIAFRMIGVETIYTVQISWFILTTSKYFKAFFFNFDALNYSYGQISPKKGGTDLSNRFGNLGFTDNIGDSFFLYAIVNGVIAFAYLGTAVYRFILN
jgi:hypothetical protein